MSSSANNVDAAAGKKDGDEDVAYFYANSEELTYPLSDKKGYYRKHIVTLDADGTIEFGINTKVVGANWNAIGCATVVKVANDYDSYIEDLLSESVAAWNTAHTNLAALDATLLPDAAESVITTELAKARPNTQEAMESATAALQALIDSYAGIKAAFDEYKALKATVEDLKNDSKYTFTGDDALSTFNSTLSDIDNDAEAATDAATLTALLPSLKSAGNTFVGAIESNDGFDLTYNIENNSFETGALSPWTTNGSNDTGVKLNSNATYTTTGVDGSYLFNTWNNGAGSKVSQTLSSLPKGYYTVTALVASDAGNTINILAGATTKGIASDATDGKAKFVEGTTDKVLADGSLEIGTNSSTWYKADYFRLTYYTEKAGAAEAWAAAKAAAEAARDDAAYTNITGSEKTALLAEIAKAEPSTAEAYGTATTALQEATSTFTAAKDSYDALVAMRTVGGTYTTVAWPRASTAKKTALDDAIAAAPTDAADAVTKTNAIETAYRQFVESNGLAEGVDVAVDKTSLLLVSDAAASTSGWTSGSIGTNTDQPYTMGNGNKPTKYFDGGWSASAGVNITLTQDLTLPAGQYQLQITARGATNLTSYTMSVGETSVDLPKDGDNGGTFGKGWSDKYITFESDGSALTLTIAAASTDYYQWISFNRLRLVKLDATLATAEDYSNLNSAIAAVEANLGFEDEEYAPYNNVTALGKLAEAKAIDQTVNNVQEDVQTLTSYLNTASNWIANDGATDIVYNGMFATVEDGANFPKGWKRTNGWGAMQSGISGDYATAYYNQPGSLQYGNQGYYTMPLGAYTIYTVTVSYRSHENNSNNGMTISVLNSDEEGMAATTFSGNGSTSEWKTVSQAFKTGAAGNYVLTLANGGNTWMTNVSITRGGSESITISDAGYATYVSDLDLDYSSVSGLTAYKATVDGQTITFNKVTTVPAGEGVLLKGDANTYSVPVTTGVAAWADADNAFIRGTGAAVESEADGKYNYILNKVGDVVGFYKANGQTVAKNRAYLQAAENAARLNFFFDDDETTGVRELKNSRSGELKSYDIYNMNGQKVEKAGKGLYIMRSAEGRLQGKNGKKVIMK